MLIDGEDISERRNSAHKLSFNQGLNTAEHPEVNEEKRSSVNKSENTPRSDLEQEEVIYNQNDE